MAKEKRQIKTRGQQQTTQPKQAQKGKRQEQRTLKPQEEELKKHGDKIRHIAD